MNTDSRISDTLAPQERQVFEVVRGAGSVTVADVVNSIAGDHKALAYTTVMTVLSRLWQKGYLDRRRDGRAYRYAARPPSEIANHLATKAAQEMIGQLGEHAVSGFVQSLSAEQRAVLTRLLKDES